MPDNELYLKIASEMLTGSESNVDRLNPILKSRLEDIDELCRIAGGGLTSRQIIASQIYQLQLELKKGIGYDLIEDTSKYEKENE